LQDFALIVDQAVAGNAAELLEQLEMRINGRQPDMQRHIKRLANAFQY